MKNHYYIFSNSVIRRKDNTLVFETGGWESLKTMDEKNISDIDAADKTGNLEKYKQQQEELLVSYDIADKFDGEIQKKYIPIENVDSIFCFGEVKFNSRFLNFLTQNNISLHIFNYYGFYSGSYYPREYLNSGDLLIRQSEFYLDKEKRLELAMEFVRGAAFNILKNLRYYLNRGSDLSSEINNIEALTACIDGMPDVPNLMGVEGNIRQIYYSCWTKIMNKEIDFERRVKRPPDNMINALISFGNMIVYTTCLSEIYRTQLNPLIGYLHEPGERRYTLSLDIAEIFKPIITDRIIFKVINQNMIGEENFSSKFNYCVMNESAKKIFVKEFDDKLKTVINHRALGRNVSYRRLIRLECYKLIKHLLGEKKYEAFKIWW
jgi:CRISPR-associated protein Cas1